LVGVNLVWSFELGLGLLTMNKRWKTVGYRAREGMAPTSTTGMRNSRSSLVTCRTSATMAAPSCAATA
jgi:hypothetical protein